MTNRLRKGGSLSGRERNCAFLNLDGQRFATVSGVSGFDFADDARSLALVDWDGDGRMDLWSSNRTAPRVRFLQNVLPETGSWIQFALESDQMIDPVGARIELTLGNGNKLLRSLRIGEGFLGQSSRVLHFGLADEEIRQIRVRWPDGEWQEMALVAPGQRYLLTRGKAQPVALSGQRVEMPEQGGALEGAPENRSRWIRMPFAIPMPPLVAARADGQKVVLPPVNGSPFLINLWDPECEDCAVELQDWKAGRSQLPKNLQLAALLANPEVTLEGGKKFVEALGLPFPWGKLEEDSAFLLAKFLQEIFQTQDSFPAPASFLVNGKGELVSFAIGKLTVDDIVSEVAAIPQNAETTLGRLQRIYGQKGLWLEPVERQNLLFVPQILVENGQVSLAASYVRRAWSHLSRHRKIDQLLVFIGHKYFKSGNVGQAVNFYLNGLNQGHGDPVIMNNAAWELATNRDGKIRNGDLALKWALKAVEVTKGRQAGFYDTLAAAYAEQGRFPQALETVKKGLEVAEKSQNLQSKDDLLRAQRLYLQNLPNRGQ